MRALTLNLLADGLARGGAGLEGPAPCPEEFADEGAGGVARRPGAESSGAESFRFACDAEALAWDRRWPQLKALITRIDPDIIGLQEVDLMQGGPENLAAHDRHIREDLRSVGYDGVFAKKLGRACDGVAVFWRRSRLRPTSRMCVWRLGRTVHVALAQPLCLDGRWHFTAVSTHLKAGLAEEAEAVRHEQAHALAEHLGASCADAVVMADLNAHCRPWRTDEGSGVTPRAYPRLLRDLRSAYREVLGDEPSFTCWGGWADREVRLVCDYVLLRGELFAPRRVLEPPPSAQVLLFPERLPNAEHPTDHVPLAADLEIAGSAAVWRNGHVEGVRPRKRPRW